MKGIYQKIERNLSASTLWIYATLLLFISYLLLISIQGDSFSRFITYFMVLSVLFLPVLVFAAWRKFLGRKLPLLLFGSIWCFCFVLHPLYLSFADVGWVNYLLNISKLEFSMLNTREFLLIVSGFILLTEIALQLSEGRLRQLKEFNWVKRISFEESLFLLMILVAIVRAAFFCGSQAFQEGSFSIGLLAKTLFNTLSFSIQIFLISLVYYFFYYANRYYLIPKILKPRGIIHYGFSIAAIILLCYPVFIFLIRFLPVVEQMNLVNYRINQNLFASDSGGGPFILIMLSLPVIVFMEWLKQTNEITILEKEKSAAELSFLKQQINPHFFFNTLNNLYALSITKDPKTPEVILQLSELMRYVIYKGKEKQSLLKDEIKYLEDYIQLQQIRLHKKMDYKFTKNIEAGELLVPPLLFIVLVENAFKHGIEVAEQNCFLHMELQANQNQLVFICENSIETTGTAKQGIGLTNLKRRLDLLFPEQHDLKTIVTEKSYKTILEINLNLITSPS